MFKYFRNLNSKFFYKVFAIITSIILVCSLSISILLYYRFNLTLTNVNKAFIKYTGNQVKSDISNLMKKNDLIAGNIYSDNSIELFLKENYYQVIDYNLFEMFNTISSYFQGIRENNPDIAGLCLYKLDQTIITDGKNVRDFSDFERQDLIKKAMDARGSSVWATYTGDDGKMRICLLKFLNVYKPGGVLMMELKEESFYNMYKPGAGDREIFIIDNDNNIVSSSQRNSLGKNFNATLGGYLPGNIGADEMKFNNVRYFFSQVEINDEWSVVTLFNADEIEKEKVNIAWFVIVLSAVFIFIGLLFSLFMASGFANQVNRLMRKIKEIEKGNLNIKPDINRKNEFHQLDKTLCSMAANIERLNSDILKAVRQKEESDIKYLQMQMNPHFLYNLLSVIRWIAFGNKQHKIISVVDHLSNFYKIVLSKGNEIIDIESEISLTRSYVELQNACYDNSIQLNIHMDERLAGLKISKMTLQPFVENSVVHGRKGDRVLNITVNILLDETGDIVIWIEDDGLGITEDIVEYIKKLNENGRLPDGRHYGIMNTVSRLNILYNGKITIRAANRDPGTLIELILKPD